jgi:lipoprotein-releasing system permease protein
VFNSGTIEIAGFINGIDMVAEDKLFKISDYIKDGKSLICPITVLL